MTQESQRNSPGETEQIEEQLLLYAKELHDLYEEEKAEREALVEEKLVLSYRLKELTALNTLFQKHLERRQHVEDVVSELAKGLREVLGERHGSVSQRRQLEQLLTLAESALEPLERPSESR